MSTSNPGWSPEHDQPDDGTPKLPKRPRGKSIKAWHLNAIRLSLAGLEAADVAKQLGKPLRTVKALMTSEWYERELLNFHRATMDAATRSGVDPIMRFQSLVAKAIHKLETKLDCGDDKTEYLAACRILDNAGFSPVKRIQVSEDEMLKGLTMEELQYVARTGQLPARRAVIEGEILAEASAPSGGDDGRDGTESARAGMDDV